MMEESEEFNREHESLSFLLVIIVTKQPTAEWTTCFLFPPGPTCPVYAIFHEMVLVLKQNCQDRCRLSRFVVPTSLLL